MNREYGALMGLPYYDLFQTVMDPPRRALYNVSAREVNEAMVTYGVNEPQARAILGSLQTKGFSLIQGLVVNTSLCLISAFPNIFVVLLGQAKLQQSWASSEHS